MSLINLEGLSTELFQIVEIMLNRKFTALLFFIIVFNQSIHGRENNCENYPYKDGLYFQKSLGKLGKYIFTSSKSFSTLQSKKINFVKLKTDSYTKSLFKNSIEYEDKFRKNNKNPFYKLLSCTDVEKGIYKVSYAQIQEINLFQRLKIFFSNNQSKP